MSGTKAQTSEGKQGQSITTEAATNKELKYREGHNLIKVGEECVPNGTGKDTPILRKK